MRRTNSFEKTLLLGKIKGRRRRGWQRMTVMDSMDMSFGRLWELVMDTGRPGVLWSMGSQRVGHDWANELNWTELTGVRKCSNFILLHVAVQFFQHHLLKRLSLPSLYIFASLVIYKVPIGSWVYFWASYLGPLVFISVFVPVPYSLGDCSFVV